MLIEQNLINSIVNDALKLFDVSVADNGNDDRKNEQLIEYFKACCMCIAAYNLILLIINKNDIKDDSNIPDDIINKYKNDLKNVITSMNDEYVKRGYQPVSNDGLNIALYASLFNLCNAICRMVTRSSLIPCCKSGALCINSKHDNNDNKDSDDDDDAKKARIIITFIGVIIKIQHAHDDEAISLSDILDTSSAIIVHASSKHMLHKAAECLITAKQGVINQ